MPEVDEITIFINHRPLWLCEEWLRLMMTKYKSIHAKPRETKSGRGEGGQKDAKWCILLHFEYKICVVKTLNIVLIKPWKNWFFFRRTQNGAFCCILDIKSVQSKLQIWYEKMESITMTSVIDWKISPAEFTKCKFISLSGMLNEMKLISPCCLKYIVIT